MHFHGVASPLNRELADEGGINTGPRKAGQGHFGGIAKFGGCYQDSNATNRRREHDLPAEPPELEPDELPAPELD
jgi:hypothetical protein